MPKQTSARSDNYHHPTASSPSNLLILPTIRGSDFFEFKPKKVRPKRATELPTKMEKNRWLANTIKEEPKFLWDYFYPPEELIRKLRSSDVHRNPYTHFCVHFSNIITSFGWKWSKKRITDAWRHMPKILKAAWNRIFREDGLTANTTMSTQSDISYQRSDSTFDHFGAPAQMPLESTSNDSLQYAAPNLANNRGSIPTYFGSPRPDFYADSAGFDLSAVVAYPHVPQPPVHWPYPVPSQSKENWVSPKSSDISIPVTNPPSPPFGLSIPGRSVGPPNFTDASGAAASIPLALNKQLFEYCAPETGFSAVARPFEQELRYSSETVLPDAPPARGYYQSELYGFDAPQLQTAFIPEIDAAEHIRSRERVRHQHPLHPLSPPQAFTPNSYGASSSPQDTLQPGHVHYFDTLSALWQASQSRNYDDGPVPYSVPSEVIDGIEVNNGHTHPSPNPFERVLEDSPQTSTAVETPSSSNAEDVQLRELLDSGVAGPWYPDELFHWVNNDHAHPSPNPFGRFLEDSPLISTAIETPSGSNAEDVQLRELFDSGVARPWCLDELFDWN